MLIQSLTFQSLNPSISVLNSLLKKGKSLGGWIGEDSREARRIIEREKIQSDSRKVFPPKARAEILQA
jgi:hypothetical protein